MAGEVRLAGLSIGAVVYAKIVVSLTRYFRYAHCNAATGSNQQQLLVVLAISAHEIHLWSAFPDQIQEHPLLLQYERLLAPCERDRLARFYFQRDRHQYLVTRALIRTVLSNYAPLRPLEWKFETNPFGRPHIANEDAGQFGLFFNVAHTDGLILMAVRKADGLGVDVENSGSRAWSAEVAEHFFSAREAAALRAVPSEERHRYFFDLWTLKEAYLKARGLGLSIPLDAFSFDYQPNHRISFNANEALDENPAQWHFWQIHVDPQFSAAICARRNSQSRLTLRLTTTVPLRSEKPGEYRLLGESS